MVILCVWEEINSSKMNFVVSTWNYGWSMSKTSYSRAVGGSPSDCLNLSQGVNNLVAFSQSNPLDSVCVSYRFAKLLHPFGQDWWHFQSRCQGSHPLVKVRFFRWQEVSILAYILPLLKASREKYYSLRIEMVYFKEVIITYFQNPINPAQLWKREYDWVSRCHWMKPVDLKVSIFCCIP